MQGAFKTGFTMYKISEIVSFGLFKVSFDLFYGGHTAIDCDISMGSPPQRFPTIYLKPVTRLSDVITQKVIL